MRKLLYRGLLAVLAILVIAIVALVILLRGSLAASSGEIALGGLTDKVVIAFDEYGIPTLSGANREDIARATGFLHAQNRFFQMDLMRRRAAGELAALLGPALVDTDRGARLHRFRALAGRIVAEGPADQRRLLEAYAAGANAGLAALWSRPFEYLLLRARPEPWIPEDSVLVNLAMFLDLHDETGGHDAALGVMQDTLPTALFDFLAREGTEWDAPIEGGPSPAVAIPGPDVVDLRNREAARGEPGDHDDDDDPFTLVAGSNVWAVGGAHTAHGGAILANDMHLGHGVPNVWYRASFEYPGTEPDEMVKVTGITLPGAFPMIAGSNTHVAWGYANTEGDWVDLVVVETDSADPDRYAAPGGPQRFERHEEIIHVAGGADVALEVVSTIWGPIVGKDSRGRPLALRWTAHDPEAVDTGLVSLETSRTLEELFDAAARSGAPPQNIVAASADGRIGWSIMGAIPRRFGFSSVREASLPQSWATGARGWDDWLMPPEYPRIILPPAGRLWVANNRAVDGAMLRLLGDGGYDLGARARQIRDDLAAIRVATQQDMLQVQLDDRALFLTRWRDLLLASLTDEAVAGYPARGQAREIARDWGGRASVDSAGYRFVRAFRQTLASDVMGALTAPCQRADAGFDWRDIGQWEGPLWDLVTQRPAHVLTAAHPTWNDRILAAVDRTITELSPDGAPLAGRTWGARNTVSIRHPFSLAIPALARWLDMPARPLPGDSNMPRVQAPGFGASERLAVSPGHEQDGYFHMPGGQSGHPLSRHYADGQNAWEEGLPTPFLPGEAVSTLTLVPEDEP